MKRFLRPVRLGFLERISRRSYGELFFIWIMMDVVFTAAYLTIYKYSPENAPDFPKTPELWKHLLDGLYFSTVTATTVGYGDIAPLGLSKMLAATESFMGFGTFGIFITKLMSRKQDIAIGEMHRMTFENIFYNTRHGLFIIRKDFDNLIHTAKEKKSLTNHNWQNLTAAYVQAQSLFEEIPKFHKGSDLYTIDAKRDLLLMDSVRRSLERIGEMLDTFDARSIPWPKHEQSLPELKKVLESASQLLMVWREHTDEEVHNELSDVQHQLQAVERRLPHRTFSKKRTRRPITTRSKKKR